MAKKETAEVRISADLPGVEDFAQSVVADPGDTSPEPSGGLPPGVEVPPPQVKRRRSRSSKPDPVRSARAHKMWETRRAKTDGGTARSAPRESEPAADNYEARMQAWNEQAAELAPLVQLGVSEFIDPLFPERPYTLQDATQLSAAAVPVLEKYGVAGKLGRYPEITLLVVALLQVNVYRKLDREHKQRARIANNGAERPAEPSRTDSRQNGLWEDDVSKSFSADFRPRYRAGPES